MDIYIKYDNDKKSIQLPILPSSISLSGSQGNTTVNVNNLGEINLKGKRGLYEVGIESFFPAQNYSFCKCTPKKPDSYIKELKQLYEKNTTLHLIVTNSRINIYCTIENITLGNNDGTKDVSYTISLKEYREISTGGRQTTKKVESKTYKWKKGDTWPKVAKKQTGKSENAKKLRAANKSVITKAKKAYKKKHPKVKKVVETTALIGSKVVIKI